MTEEQMRELFIALRNSIADEFAAGQLAARIKYGTFDSDVVAALAAMRCVEAETVKKCEEQELRLLRRSNAIAKKYGEK